MLKLPIYLDHHSTTPLDPLVFEAMTPFLKENFGNPSSTTHAFGWKAKEACDHAREAAAALIHAEAKEIVFTSGATESNNLALLGLRKFGEEAGKKHIISTQIEHKAVLEPLQSLAEHGFEISLLPPNCGGWVEPASVREALRADTLLVSVMHANNETGVIQPIDEIAEILAEHPAFFHTDAAQGFGKDIAPLQNPRLDLISISGHKIYAPKGIGALIARRRNFKRPPLSPLMFGGGQERGIRPGTLPVHLIVGLGQATQLAMENAGKRAQKCSLFKDRILKALAPLEPKIHGDQSRTFSHVLSLSFSGIDSEAVMLGLKDVVAISNGSACTSESYEPSHVLIAMGLSEEQAHTALRWSWCHMTEEPNWDQILKIIGSGAV